MLNFTDSLRRESAQKVHIKQCKIRRNATYIKNVKWTQIEVSSSADVTVKNRSPI